MADSKDSGKGNDENGGFKQFLWNPDTKEFLGRSGSSWAKIIIFYIIFYACLAAFWALMLAIFYQTIDQQEPKWKLDESRIGSNPGLGFRPRPPAEKVESTLIWFKTSDKKGYEHWSSNLEEFLKPYTQPNAQGGGENAASATECTGNAGPEPGKYCPFEYDQLIKPKPSVGGKPGEACTATDSFGYSQGKPCVLIKLNRIYGWEPVPYTTANFPANMPSPPTTNPSGIYVTCEGENPADKEHIGPLEYFPNQVIESRYFPFTNQAGYLSPIVLVKFTSPSTGVLINVECKAWAQNIKHDRQDREGSVHFELLID
ncbi:Sodium/potassium-transporting ATPase subunit beta-2 [Halotydeus destructor]|nr:Sodium/potassium-transporting ATPase subunit beta-2 [Halotydeus destructor]